MILETVVVGPLGVNCYIIGCAETRDSAVVDPGADAAKILAVVAKLGLTVKYVLNTHGHFDHVGGNREVLAATGAKLLIHEGDLHFLSRAADTAAMYGAKAENSPRPDGFLDEAQPVSFGRKTLKVLHTPGHTPGGCCFYLEGTVITGDTLFAASVGRTDFPGSSHEALMEGIRSRLMPLPDETAVYPGHGPSTTIGRERRTNPYILGEER